jgi:tetratricopeptide (TPR) repeat protein
MKLASVLIALALTVPAGAATDKPRDKKKPAESPSAGSVVREAEAKAAAGDSDGAVELLRRAAAAPGASGEIALRLGRFHEQRFEVDLAIDAYAAAATALAGAARAEALGRLSVAQEIRGMPEAARSAVDAAAADPGAAWANVALARLRAREGKGDEALALAQKAEAGGAGAAALAALGAAHEALGDLAAAEAALRRAQADPELRVIAGLGLARVLRRTGRAADAEPLVKELLAQAPGAIEGYKESARVKMALGHADDAMDDAVTAAAMAESDADAQRLVQEVAVARGLEMLAAQRVAEAVQVLTRLRDQHPDSAAARVALARALIAQRQATPALAELQKALEIDPGSAEAHYRAGLVHHVLKGDAAAAVGHLEKAAGADPSNAEYRTQLGAALIDLKQYDRAEAELHKATAAAGASAASWTYLGAAHLGSKQYKDAIAALEKAAVLSPEDAQVEAYLAWSYFGLKDSAQFVTHGARARELGHKEKTLLDYVSRVQKGEPIK